VNLKSDEISLSNIDAIAFDFDGVFTDNLVYVMENGDEAVVCNRSDGMGISMLRKSNIALVIISTEKNPVVSVRGAKLNIEVLQGIDDKLPKLQNWASDLGMSMDRVAFVGNDINDVECLRAAGVGIVVADAYPVAVDAADMMLNKNGGHGAVRELADLWLEAHSQE
jgi:N-acylneuraminate cytidylyltransferase